MAHLYENVDLAKQPLYVNTQGIAAGNRAPF
jgi:hypothetical protein